MLAAGHLINFPMLANLLRGFSYRLLWKSETDCKTAQECRQRTVTCIRSIERRTGAWHFNHSLCDMFVTKYLVRVRELLEDQKDEIEKWSEKCLPSLAALHNAVKEAEFLIEKHASSTWIRAAVELVENTSAFAEVIFDLKWYMHALKIAIENETPQRARKQRIYDLQKLAMAECGKFLEDWECDCRLLGLERDRGALLAKLKVDSNAAINSLDSYLAQKLWRREDQSVQAVAMNLNAPEVLHQKKVLLGSGSFGRVYKVHWLGMPCALKSLSGEVVGEEVNILSKLHHPNIIQLYGYFVERGTLHLIMELMEFSMREYIETKQWGEFQRTSPLDFLRVALDSMLQIAKGVRYLHSQGMAHRDLKGENVLVQPSDNPDLKSKGYLTVKLTDFGLAKANLHNSTVTSLTTNIGTLAWKAPELFKVVQPDSQTQIRRKHYPFKPDVYSFAMVCYEILSGKKPFSNVQILSTTIFYAKVRRGERPVLPESINILPGLSDYIARCWDTDPCRRPDFVDICKRIRHFRDSLLQITAYSGWEHKPQENTFSEPSDIDENDFIDITNVWDWEIDYKDIVRGEEQLTGGSGFASVWPAHWKTSEPVLAKYIWHELIDTDESIGRFKQEMAILVRMQHENLVSYLGATTKSPFVVFTEFAQGVTLNKFLSNKRKVRPLSRLEIVNIALQVARGMRSLHEEDVTIIHGELSPDCIMIDETSLSARVADFGMLSFRRPPPHHFTRWYRRAPEQHLGLPLHTSVDVFSFGMILYDLFERERARLFWKTKKASELLKNGGRPELNSATLYPLGIKSLIEKCWSTDWQARPSFGSIVTDLEKTISKLNSLRTSSIKRSSSSSSSRKATSSSSSNSSSSRKAT